MSSVLTRRDRCYLIGRRAARLSLPQAADAWFRFASKVEALGDRDVPKFEPENRELDYLRRLPCR